MGNNHANTPTPRYGSTQTRRPADPTPPRPVLGIFDYFLGEKAACYLLWWSKIEDEDENEREHD